MNHVAQHVPNFVEMRRHDRKFSEFKTTEELLAIDWIASWADSCIDPVFCKSPPTWDLDAPRDRWMLMVDGFEHRHPEKPWWWVIGYLEDGESVNLPVWDSKTRGGLH